MSDKIIKAQYIKIFKDAVNENLADGKLTTTGAYKAYDKFTKSLIEILIEKRYLKIQNFGVIILKEVSEKVCALPKAEGKVIEKHLKTRFKPTLSLSNIIKSVKFKKEKQMKTKVVPKK